MVVLSIQAPEGETQPSTEVDLFISTEKIMVLNTDLKVRVVSLSQAVACYYGTWTLIFVFTEAAFLAHFNIIFPFLLRSQVTKCKYNVNIFGADIVR